MVHMRVNIRKMIYPLMDLPEGYTTFLIEVQNLTEEDRAHWKRIQHQRENVVTHDKLLIPDEGAVSFAKYHGERIACGAITKISDRVYESGHLMVLSEHRRKGIFKALIGETWRHCYMKGVIWLNLSPGIQVKFWDQFRAKKGWASP